MRNKKNRIVIIFSLFLIIITFSSCMSLIPNETKKTTYTKPNQTTVDDNSKKDTKVQGKTITLPALLAIKDDYGNLLNVIDSAETVSGFVIWDCKEYLRGKETLFQIGYFELIDRETNQKNAYGILLFDEPFLNEIKWKEGTPMPGELISEYEVPTDRILLEIGIIPEATTGLFKKDGLNYSLWWNNSRIENSSYEIIIKPDGTVLYYDFTDVPYGESIKPNEVLSGYKHIVRGPSYLNFYTNNGEVSD